MRDRPEDILLLAETFMRRFALENDSRAKKFSKDAIKYMLENQWQGNIRELENTVERAVVLCSGLEITLENLVPFSGSHLRNNVTSSNAHPEENTFRITHINQLPSLDEVINKYIAYAIHQNGGARDKAAKDIGIDRKTLYRRMQYENLNRIQ